MQSSIIQALIDGPCTNVCRKALNFKHLSLTDFKVKVAPSAKSGPVKKAFEKGEILEKWEKTAWAKKLATRKKRTTLTDFDRFKLKLAKQKVCFFFFNSPCIFRSKVSGLFISGQHLTLVADKSCESTRYNVAVIKSSQNCGPTTFSVFDPKLLDVIGQQC